MTRATVADDAAHAPNPGPHRKLPCTVGEHNQLGPPMCQLERNCGAISLALLCVIMFGDEINEITNLKHNPFLGDQRAHSVN